VQPNSDSHGRECGAETGNDVLWNKTKPAKYISKNAIELKHNMSVVGSLLNSPDRLFISSSLGTMPFGIAGYRISYTGRDEFTVIQLTLIESFCKEPCAVR
jgi:hypothetical protein